MSKKVFIKTFGCQMNVYDSDKMRDLLAATDGMTQTDRAEDADVILFNTCSVREKAEEKVFSDLGRAYDLKRLKPDLIIGVGGCVASQEGAAIVKRAPYVDVVFGPQTLHRLSDLIAARRQSGQSQVDISFPEIEKFDHLPAAQVTSGSAFVSIMEGCSKYCSFCVVPYTRGEEVSRPFTDVLHEVASLTARGVKEITLLGQNVNAYQGQMDDSEDLADLALLLEYLHEMPGVERLRFTTSHPKEMSPRLIQCFATLPKLSSHLHLPVQAGSDRVLMAMKRGYTALEYKSLIRKLRAVLPDLTVTSDFIIGFPGETDAEFEKTLQLIDDIGFDQSFSFVYSPRPGTPAAEMADETPADIKMARLAKLQNKITAHSKILSAALLGSVQRVMVENISRKDANEVAGRTDSNRIVNFAGSPRLIGHMVDVTITEVLPNTLRGEICHVAPVLSA